VALSRIKCFGLDICLQQYYEEQPKSLVGSLYISTLLSESTPVALRVDSFDIGSGETVIMKDLTP
jgi:hypothetical protein